MAKRSQPPGARPSPNPRRHAIEVVSLALEGKAFAQDEMERRLRTSRISDADRRLLHEIAYGVIRRKASLDCALAAVLTRSLADVQPAVLQILRTAAFQMLFMDRVPPYAAVSEAVELARATGHARAAGFVNAALRKLAREARRSDEPEGPEDRRIPRDEGWVGFPKAVLPDPSQRAEFLAAAYSYPAWAVRRWLDRYGEETAVRIMRVMNKVAPVSVRPNYSRLGPGELREKLAAEGVDARPSASGRTLVLPHNVHFSALASFAEGDFQPQDDAASLAAPMLAPQPGERVLDLCAAPGGKATHLAELLRGEGRIDAVDVSEEKLNHLRLNLRRLGLKGVECFAANGAAFAKARAGTYDAALVDAPCSNSGVLRRRVEARWRLGEEALKELAAIQHALLAAAAEALKPGGRLLYGTCSLEPEENQETARWGAGTCGLTLEREEQLLPCEQHDGAYFALMRKPPEG